MIAGKVMSACIMISSPCAFSRLVCKCAFKAIARCIMFWLLKKECKFFSISPRAELRFLSRWGRITDWRMHSWWSHTNSDLYCRVWKCALVEPSITCNDKRSRHNYNRLWPLWTNRLGLFNIFQKRNVCKLIWSHILFNIIDLPLVGNMPTCLYEAV